MYIPSTGFGGVGNRKNHEKSRKTRKTPIWSKSGQNDISGVFVGFCISQDQIRPLFWDPKEALLHIVLPKIIVFSGIYPPLKQRLFWPPNLMLALWINRALGTDGEATITPETRAFLHNHVTFAKSCFLTPPVEPSPLFWSFFRFSTS